MLKATTYIRVRYGEVDQMGFLYYGNYALYYEVARAEIMRENGYPYSKMEKDGVVMPVVNMKTKYLKPAHYEDLIRVETYIMELRDIPFITFHHKLYNEKNELINVGEVTLTFFNLASQKKVAMPDKLRNILLPYFGI